MNKFAIEYKKVEIHFFEVNAESIDEAKKLVNRDNIEPIEINTLSYGLHTYEKIEDEQNMLTGNEYFELNKGNHNVFKT